MHHGLHMRSLRSFHLLILLALGAVLVPRGQQGEATAEPQLPHFEHLDLNRDAHLSVTELTQVPVPSDLFQQADYDRDGLLSLLEFQSVLDAPPTPR